MRYGSALQGREGLCQATQRAHEETAATRPPALFRRHAANGPVKAKWGLALSGGAARGLAHIGVIQVLEENGLAPDIVAGSSMGAYIGALWCSGLDGAALEREAHDTSQWRALAELIDPVVPPRRGFLRGDQIRRRLSSTICAAHFSQLRTPLIVTATNLDTLACELLTSGDVSQAVLASCAIPGICEPVMRCGSRYTDGAVTAPVPVSPLLDRGLDVVIAVNVMPPPSDTVGTPARKSERAASDTGFWGALHRRLNYFAKGNLLDTVYRSLGAAQGILAEGACRQAEVVIRPLCEDALWYEFHLPAKHIALGRAAALAQLPKLRALLVRKAAA